MTMQITRIDSCRGCGERLSVKTICAECGEPKYWTCTNCNHWYDDPPHDCKLNLN